MKSRLALATTAALLSSLALAAAASAAPPTVDVTGDQNGGRATFTDDGTNTDQVVVRVVSTSVPGATAYQFTDSVAMSSGNPLACNGGTPAVSTGTTLTCTVPQGKGVDVDLGDAPGHASQSVQFAGTGWNGQSNTGLGGSGDDTFEGGTSNDTFTGRGGSDTFDGNGGTDTVSYASSTVAVAAAIDGRPDSGEGCPSTCERDTINTDISNLTGGSANDVLIGDDAANALDGGTGNDALYGMGGGDTLTGDDGDDDLDGGLGNDSLDGGAGSNTADYSNDGRPSGVTVHLDTNKALGANGEVDTFVTTSTGPQTTRTIENVIGSDFNDLIVGNTDANDVHGGPGTDEMSYTTATAGVTVSLDDKANDGIAGEGDNVHSDVEVLDGTSKDDTFLAGNASEEFLGHGGNNTLSFANISDPVGISLASGAGTAGANSYTIPGHDIESVIGGPGDDLLIGDGKANVLDGGAGNDHLIGGLGADHLIGGAGSDTADYDSDGRTVGVQVDLNAGTETPLSKNAAQEDTLSEVENALGTPFADQLYGDSGTNVLTGDAGDDTLRGRGGADVLEPGTDNDLVSGGAGSDTVSYADRAGDVTVNLDGKPDSGESGEKDTIQVDVENIAGGAGNDTLNADTDPKDVVNNLVAGGAGNDTITTLGGNDTIVGGGGQDTVDAGAGDDLLELVDGEIDTATCGDGNDTVNADAIDKLSADCETVNIAASSQPPSPAPSVLLITSPKLKEGNSGTRTMTFTVALNGAQAAAVSVPYATADVTAKAGSDYKATSGTLTFNPGETSKTVAVTIIGDKRYEKNETFALVLGKPVGNATLPTKFYGTGTIVNDDKKPRRHKRKPASFSAKVTPRHDSTAPFVFRVSGAIGVPGGVSVKHACTGKVLVTVIATHARSHTRVRVNKACRYRFGLSSNLAPANHRVTFRVQFLGNKYLAKSARRTLHATAG